MPNSSLPALLLSLVDDLPSENILHMVGLLEREGELNWHRLTNLLISVVPSLEAQEQVRLFIKGWRVLPNPPTPHEMALLLQAVSYSMEQQRCNQKVDLIWTGPRTRLINVRRTDQALIELIDTAKHDIIVVSFAVYKAKNILEALARAAARGVEIKIILESPDESEGKIVYNTIRALGKSLREKSKVFIWPHAKRLFTSDGKVGSLHAKCAVADGRQLYISSANLTDFAMNLNMELGVVIEKDDLPLRVKQLFEELIAQHVLSEIADA